MLVDYHVHVLDHEGRHAYTADRLEEYLVTALRHGIAEIGLAEHDDRREVINWALTGEAQALHPGVRIRRGMEVEYRPEDEESTRTLLASLPLDYAIGSVHFVDGWPFDDPDFESGYVGRDIDHLYEAYYGLLERAVRSRMFDVVGHIDVVKVFGYRPSGSPLVYAEPVLRAIRDSGMCVEINTAGLHKPVKELYPAAEILARCYAFNIPVTFGSDAHSPEHVGRDITCAMDTARQAGYRRCATFCKRQMELVDL